MEQENKKSDHISFQFLFGTYRQGLEQVTLCLPNYLAMKKEERRE